MRINKTEDDLLWGPYYEAVLNLLGSTAVILPIGDTPLHEAAARTSFVTVGGEALTFTYSKSVATWDTPPKVMGPGRIPIITFDGTDEQADSPDAAYWTRADAAFSMGAWVNMTDATSSTILAKLDTTGNQREWEFGFTSADKIALFIYDETDAENDSISATATSAQTEGVWAFVVATTAGVIHTDIELYIDGAVDATPTQADSGNFDICRNGTATVTLGCSNATPANLFDGAMAGGPLAPFFVQTELGADVILRLYQLGRRALGV